MRYPAAETAEKHQRILDEASRLFRERGFAGVSVGEIMKATGLTHGPFYNHFASKQALMAEGIRHASEKTLTDLRAVPGTGEGRSAYVARYLSADHRDAPGQGCLMAALACEISREPEVKRSFTLHLKTYIDTFTRHFPWPRKQDARGDAIRMLSSMVGALILARAVDDDVLADEILREVKSKLG
ncbi:MAG: TetR/AcrR family transcriptional regulator [Beijerinckiaceae bacterium]|nr:TetR/AcrR family transcriptional regulator [Beijerinckiaceae bacterium]